MREAQSLDSAGKVVERHRPFEIKETHRVRPHLLSDPRTYCSYLFVEFVHRYLRIFVIQDRAPRDIISDAVFCILFIAFWRRDISLRQKADNTNIGVTTASLCKNFITSQTATDVLITCNMVVLASLLFRKRFPNVRFDLSRMSSRFSEYVFQVW